MKIGVDATSWVNGRGYGRFTRELLRAVVRLGPEHQWILFIDSQSADRIDLDGRVRKVLVSPSRPPSAAAAADGHRGLMDMLRFTRAVGRERPDVFFFPTVYTWFPLPPGIKNLVCIHDAIAERHPELTFPSRRARIFWNLKVRGAIRQSRLVLTVSEFSRRELTEVLHIPSAKLRVAVEAPSAAFTPSRDPAVIAGEASRHGVPAGSRWFIYVGGFNPHKHVDVLVRAHAALARDVTPAPHLLLVGTLSGDVFHGDQGRIRRTIRECGTEALVHWCGFVPDEDLRHLHGGAVACVLASECEGFGLPAVEAAACGAPVIATRHSPLPELLEGGGIFVEPRDVDGLVVAMRSLAMDDDLRRRLGQAALARAATLTWDAAARATLAALAEAAA